jgi:hypothetical protein
MGREQVVQIYSRTTGSVTASNAAYTEAQFTCPAEGRIRRVRAEFAAGSVGTQIALQVREQTGVSTGLPVILAYALTPTNIDSLEDVFEIADTIIDPATSEPLPVLYIAVTTNNAAVDTINLSIDFEACA